MDASSEDPNRATAGSFVGRRDVTRWATPFGRGLAGVHHRLSARAGHHGALVISLATGGAIAVAATLAATRVYDGVADRNGIERLDRPALRMAKQLRSPLTDGAAKGIAYVFGPIGMPALALAAGTALAVRQRSVAPLTVLAAASGGSILMTVGGKDMIHRHRPPRRDAIPPYESSPSFPSGHTLNATTVTGVLAYLLILRQRGQAPQIATVAAGCITAVTVGLSRVLLGAHWFTDVLTGWIAGTGWLSLVITSHRLYLTSERESD